MTYVGTCPECGQRIALSSGDRCKRHGLGQHYRRADPCKGSGKVALAPVEFQHAGRPIRQTVV